MTTTKLRNQIQDWLEENQNPVDAPRMKSYMKDQYEYYGIKSPVRNVLSSRIYKEHKAFILENLEEFVHVMWNEPYREYQYIAMDVLKKSKNKLTLENLPMVEWLITQKSWWDTVDFLASTLVGYIFSKNPELIYPKVEAYLNSGNMWLQRTAVLFQLKYGQLTDKELLFDTIRQLRGGKEFFINKALGWALRQYSKYNPGAVGEFIETEKATLSGLTIREGSKYL